MRVLIAVHHYPPRRVGGAEYVAQRQARWLARHGIETRVVCVEAVSFGRSGLTWQDDELDTIPVRRLHLAYPDRIAALRAPFEDPSLVEHLEELTRDWQPDVVHLISGYLLGSAPLRAARMNRARTVVTLTDFWFLCPTIQLLKGDGSLCNGPELIECVRCLGDGQRPLGALDRRVPRLMQGLWRAAEDTPLLGRGMGLPPLQSALRARRENLMQALNEADAILPVTQFLAEMYLKNGLDPRNVFVKPNGLVLDAFAPIGSRAPKHEVVFGYMGQVSPIKGVHILLRAFRQVREANPATALRLVIYGNWNAEQKYTDELERLKAKDSAITFVGPYEHREALSLLAGMNAVVVPSLWYENAPIVIQEAFASGTPVIGTNVGGIAELVKHEHNGLLFERGNVNDLARLMQRVIDEPDLAGKLRGNLPAIRLHEQDMAELMAIYTRVLTKTGRNTG